MFFDARQFSTGDRFVADVCVIGAGAAGIAIALELAEKAIDVIVVEGGGLKREAASQALYAGQVAGLPLPPPSLSRSRFFGGSTNCWGGYCRPMEPSDFPNRPWMGADSGWPLRIEDLAPHFGRAHELLDLGPFEYDPEYWNRRLETARLGLFALAGERVVNSIERMSPPARFGQMYRSRLKAAQNVRVFLHANATELGSNPAGGHIDRLAISTLAGARFTIASRLYILASGGVENVRLLLASDRVDPAGVANRSGLVGRYFMDHPRFRSARLRLADQARHRRVYDGAFSQWRRRIEAGLRVSADLVLTAPTRVAEQLPNSRSYLVTEYPFSNSAAYVAAKAIKQVLRQRRQYGLPTEELALQFWQSLPIVLRQAPIAVVGVLDTIFDMETIRRTFRLETVLEPAPNFDSRICLVDERDALGVRKVKIDWRLTDLDKKNFFRASRIVLDELLSAGVVQLVGRQPDMEEAWSEEVRGSWHHIGGTRMSADAKQGVVDADCRAHGVDNLYIAGSSVFPTAGSASPTLTIVALALRLAAHVRGALAAGAQPT